MLLIHYYAAVVGAGALTAAWLFRPGERTAVTSLSAFALWTLVAALGDGVERFDESVETVRTVNNTTLAVDTTGELVTVPVPAEFRLIALLWALLSGLAFILYILGVYPPSDATGEDPTEANS